MAKAKSLLLVFLLFTLGTSRAFAFTPNCSKYISSEDAQFADKYMQYFRDGNVDQIMAVTDPKIKSQVSTVVDEFKKIFTTVESFDRVLFDCSVTYFKPFGSESKSKVVALSYEWSGKDTWYSANLRWTEQGNQRLVDVLHIDPLAAPLEKIHAFTLDGKGISNWIFSILAIANVLFTFFVFILCLRTKVPRFKWLWVIFILMGIGKINFVWTTGEIIMGWASLFSVQLFSAGYIRASDYSPVMMSISIPLGAIVFLFLRRKWLPSPEHAS
jgi:hypothetical protein